MLKDRLDSIVGIAMVMFLILLFKGFNILLAWIG